MSLPYRTASLSVRTRWLLCTSAPHPSQCSHHLQRAFIHCRHAATAAVRNASTTTTSSAPTTTTHTHPSPSTAASPAPQSSSPFSSSATDTQARPTPSSSALPSPDQLRTSLQYCIDQVQRTDPTAYLTTLFTPPASRPALFILRALWIELSRIRQSTADTRIAAMKLSWWNTTIRQLYTQPHQPPPSQPVVVALHYLVQRHALTQRLFSRLVQAKVSDVEYVAPPASIAELDAYNESTYSSLLYLALQCIAGQQASVQADHVASHVGKALGLTRMLQSLPTQARQQRCYIPATIMQQCRVEEQSVWSGESSDGLREAVFELASNAKSHIAHARSHCAGLSKEQVCVMLDVVSMERWLDQLEAVNFDVFDASLVEMERQGWEPLKLRWALWNHSRKGTF